MRKYLPLLIKTLGTIYLLEVPVLLWLRLIVLMFVPSKNDWTDEFHGIQYRTWHSVLLIASIGFLCSGIACWVAGVRLARHHPGARQAWRTLVSLLMIGQLAWLCWVFLAPDRLLLFHLAQAALVAALAIHAWVVPPKFSVDR